MGNLIQLDKWRSMDERIQIARRLFRADHKSFLEQIQAEEKPRRDGQGLSLDSEKLWSQDDNSIDKLVKLALNTAKSIKDRKEDA